jgi:hypothetical protein
MTVRDAVENMSALDSIKKELVKRMIARGVVCNIGKVHPRIVYFFIASGQPCATIQFGYGWNAGYIGATITNDDLRGL